MSARPRRPESSGGTIAGPFGHLTQKELAELRALGASREDILIVVVIRVRLSGSDRWCHDTAGSLAKWSTIPLRTVMRSLARLQAWGVVEAGPDLPVYGGPRGMSHYKPRRVTHFLQSRPAGEARTPANEPASQARPSATIVPPRTKSAPESANGHAPLARIPEVPPKSLPNTPSSASTRVGSPSPENAAHLIIDGASEPWRSSLESLLSGGMAKSNFVAWFTGTRLVGASTIAVPNAFAREWLEKHYEPIVARVLDVDGVTFVLQNDAESPVLTSGAAT